MLDLEWAKKYFSERRGRDEVHLFAERMGKRPETIQVLLPLLDEPYPMNFCLSWALDHLSGKNPEVLKEHVEFLFKKEPEMDYPGYKRSLTKIMANAGIPETIEGEAVDKLFGWLMHPDTDVAVKMYSMQALFNLAQKYPDLQGELKIVIEEQLPHGSSGFKNRARKLLQKLG